MLIFFVLGKNGNNAPEEGKFPDKMMFECLITRFTLQGFAIPKLFILIDLDSD
jgi:hypothetical protein